MRTTPTALLGLALATALTPPAHAQCEPQRFWPDFEPRSLEFGVAVALSDEHLLVVDRFADKVYTYRKDGQGQWALNHTVPGASAGAISLDGDRFLTGSLGIDAWGGGIVYDFDGHRWVEAGRLESFDDHRWRSWGYAATIHGDRASICNANSGVLLFHEVEAGAWEHGEPMTVPGGITGSGFGNAMAMDDRFFFVGAPSENITGSQNGAVYVYEWDTDGEPQLVQKLEPEPAGVGPSLGASLAIDGDTLIVGAWRDRLGSHTVGAVYIYEYDGTRWNLAQKITADERRTGAVFGWSVAIGGGLVVVGAHNDRDLARGRGIAYVFQRDQQRTWHQLATIENEVGGADFTEAVALGGGQLAIGCSESISMGFDQGFAEVHDLDCILCQADLDADGTLTIFDFLTFFNLFDDGDAQADFDGDEELTSLDFLAFQTAFDAGCE